MRYILGITEPVWLLPSLPGQRRSPESFPWKATKLVVKTMKLGKAGVKKSLLGSKIKIVKVKVGKKAVNKKYIKIYRKIFTKKNAGKKVTVK